MAEKIGGGFPKQEKSKVEAKPKEKTLEYYRQISEKTALSESDFVAYSEDIDLIQDFFHNLDIKNMEDLRQRIRDDIISWNGSKEYKEIMEKIGTELYEREIKNIESLEDSINFIRSSADYSFFVSYSDRHELNNIIYEKIDREISEMIVDKNIKKISYLIDYMKDEYIFDEYFRRYKGVARYTEDIEREKKSLKNDLEDVLDKRLKEIYNNLDIYDDFPSAVEVYNNEVKYLHHKSSLGIIRVVHENLESKIKDLFPEFVEKATTIEELEYAYRNKPTDIEYKDVQELLEKIENKINHKINQKN